MVYIRSRKFCCCLPVRLGVFALSIMGLLGAGIVAIACWVRVAHLNVNPLDDQQRRTLYAFAGLYSLIALVSFFGLVGTIIKNRPCVVAYDYMICILFLISVASSIQTLRVAFHEKSPETIQKCTDGSTSDLREEACKAAFAIGKELALAIYVITWLIQLYAVVIVDNYVEQLANEHKAKHAYITRLASRDPEAQPMTMYPAGAPEFHEPAADYSRVSSHVQ